MLHLLLGNIDVDNLFYRLDCFVETGRKRLDTLSAIITKIMESDRLLRFINVKQTIIINYQLTNFIVPVAVGSMSKRDPPS